MELVSEKPRIIMKRTTLLFQKLFLLSTVCLINFSTLVVNSQNIHENAGTRAMPFLKIGIGAKGISMGESQVALANDMYAAYWNPAGLSSVKRTQFAAMHNNWFEGISHQFIGISQPVGGGVIGTSIISLSYGTITGRDANGKETKEFRPRDLAVLLSYGQKFGNTALGFNLKWVSEKIIEDIGAQVIASDLGVLHSIPARNLAIGLNVQNLGTKAKFVEGSEEEFSLPVNIKLGFAYRVPGDKLAVTADINRPSDNDLTFGFGVSLTVLQRLHLRTGYKYELGGNDLGAASGIATGFGINVGDFGLDYALGTLGKFGTVHRFSLLSNF